MDYSKGSFSDPSGASLSLDPSQYDMDANDDGDAWCKATVEDGTEGLKGSPGEVNPGC